MNVVIFLILLSNINTSVFVSHTCLTAAWELTLNCLELIEDHVNIQRISSGLP